MILIADSGSTKTDWALLSEKKVQRFTTQGLNPFHQIENTILQILREELIPHLQETIPSNIFFYGAGCNAQAAPRLEKCLKQLFPEAEVEVESDLLGAARALCGKEPGVACILGTGSNSCLYDGEKIVKNTPPLGYILGDEGSGAVLGKKLLNHIYKDELYKDMREPFEAFVGLSYAEIIDRVYRQPLANRFLASLVDFIAINMTEYKNLEDLVIENFEEFFNKNVRPYHCRLSYDVHCVGGIAYGFKHQLLKAARMNNFHIGNIMNRPIDGLIEYHKS